MEHWLMEDYLKVIKIDQYKLVILAERFKIMVDLACVKITHFYQKIKLFSGYYYRKGFLSVGD
jgi:hypothetical protein